MKALSSLLLLSAISVRTEPISLHPQNPHYFLFRGKPTVLVTSGEHYGAVLNLDFDFVRYLDTLRADKLNLTRTFSGAYCEPSGSFNIRSNTLAPARDRRPQPAIGPRPRVAGRRPGLQRQPGAGRAGDRPDHRQRRAEGDRPVRAWAVGRGPWGVKRGA